MLAVLSSLDPQRSPAALPSAYTRRWLGSDQKQVRGCAGRTVASHSISNIFLYMRAQGQELSRSLITAKY